MPTLPANDTRTKNERPSLAGDLTIWIVSVSPSRDSTAFSVFRGPRLVEAVNARLERERRAGRSVTVQLETGSCSPVTLTVEELAALGVLS